ncbi:MAG TPA: alpha/beta hydrolase [Microscillaceae bacterium]|jgi:pimeloyl-ACP methyl ester carboxylesterase|nr:alpha/beta hydrolase [Microscillaceae bacterium]
MNKQQAQRPSPLMLLLEPGRAVLSLAAYALLRPMLQTLPKGDGHPVIVLPGFMANDYSTAIMRNFLKEQGYAAYGWFQGNNLGNYDRIEPILHKQILRLYQQHKQKVSLIGWSLGGVFARDMARQMPDKIRQVITLGSPFGNLTTQHYASFIFELIHNKKVADLDPELLERLQGQVPSVPTTAIYSKSDGVVSWEFCKDETDGHQNENIEVLGSHVGLGHNPMVLACLADRLSQPEDHWQPFKNSELSKNFKDWGVYQR